MAAINEPLGRWLSLWLATLTHPGDDLAIINAYINNIRLHHKY